VIGNREEDAVLVERFLQSLVLPAHREAIETEPDRELVAWDLRTDRWRKAQAQFLLRDFAHKTLVPLIVLSMFALDVYDVACTSVNGADSPNGDPGRPTEHNARTVFRQARDHQAAQVSSSSRQKGQSFTHKEFAPSCRS
jgi:hypothetical protein